MADASAIDTLTGEALAATVTTDSEVADASARVEEETALGDAPTSDGCEGMAPTLLMGPRGDDGAPGAKGDRGERGERGHMGLRGHRGEQGRPGLAGERGADGRVVNDWHRAWRSGEEYPRGAIVSHKGSSWIAPEATSTEPGGTGGGWDMFAARGRDGVALAGGGASTSNSSTTTTGQTVITITRAERATDANGTIQAGVFAERQRIASVKYAAVDPNTDSVYAPTPNFSLTSEGQSALHVDAAPLYGINANEWNDATIGEEYLEAGESLVLELASFPNRPNETERHIVQIPDGETLRLAFRAPSSGWRLASVRAHFASEADTGTLDIVKANSGTDPAEGTSMLDAPIDLTGAAFTSTPGTPDDTGEAPPSHIANGQLAWIVLSSITGSLEGLSVDLTFAAATGPLGVTVQITLEEAES